MFLCCCCKPKEPKPVERPPVIHNAIESKPHGVEIEIQTEDFYNGIEDPVIPGTPKEEEPDPPEVENSSPWGVVIKELVQKQESRETLYDSPLLKRLDFVGRVGPTPTTYKPKEQPSNILNGHVNEGFQEDSSDSDFEDRKSRNSKSRNKDIVLKSFSSSSVENTTPKNPDSSDPPVLIKRKKKAPKIADLANSSFTETVEKVNPRISPNTSSKNSISSSDSANPIKRKLPSNKSVHAPPPPPPPPAVNDGSTQHSPNQPKLTTSTIITSKASSQCVASPCKQLENKELTTLSETKVNGPCTSVEKVEGKHSEHRTVSNFETKTVSSNLEKSVAVEVEGSDPSSARGVEFIKSTNKAATVINKIDEKCENVPDEIQSTAYVKGVEKTLKDTHSKHDNGSKSKEVEASGVGSGSKLVVAKELSVSNLNKNQKIVATSDERSINQTEINFKQSGGNCSNSEVTASGVYQSPKSEDIAKTAVFQKTFDQDRRTEVSLAKSIPETATNSEFTKEIPKSKTIADESSVIRSKPAEIVEETVFKCTLKHEDVDQASYKNLPDTLIVSKASNAESGSKFVKVTKATDVGNSTNSEKRVKVSDIKMTPLEEINEVSRVKNSSEPQDSVKATGTAISSSGEASNITEVNCKTKPKIEVSCMKELPKAKEVTRVALVNSSSRTEDVAKASDVNGQAQPVQIVGTFCVENSDKSCKTVVDTSVPEAKAVVDTSVPERKAVVDASVPEAKAVVDTSVPEAKAVVDTLVPEAKAVVDASVPEAKAVVDASVPEAKAVVDTSVPEGKAVVDTSVPEERRWLIPQFLKERRWLILLFLKERRWLILLFLKERRWLILVFLKERRWLILVFLKER